MIMDLQCTVSDSQSITATAVSTNGLDLGVAGTVPGMGPSGVSNGVPIKDTGRGNTVSVLAQVTTAFTAAGAATMQAQLVIADDAALTTNLLVLHQTPPIAKALLVPGYQFRLGGSIPPGVTQRFAGVNYVVATGPMTAGKVLATMGADRHSSGNV